jgi:GNAT superfamily N-acetyltransferase
MPDNLLNLKRIRRLEEITFRAWPALDTASHAGWLQRFSDGYTKRANSINALETLPEIYSEAIDALEAPYRARGLPPVWRITPLAPPAADGLLEARGYRRIEESLVQLAPLDGSFVPDPAVTIASHPSSQWLTGFAELSPVSPPHRPTMTRMLQSIAPPVGFALVEEAGRPLAFALGVVEDDHLGLFDILVSPAARRRGLARRVLRSVCAWGYAQGARFAYLQVVDTNAAARPLYVEHGFETVYTYWYRVPPSLLSSRPRPPVA